MLINSDWRLERDPERDEREAWERAASEAGERAPEETLATS
jgi:hypothetical protein